MFKAKTRHLISIIMMLIMIMISSVCLAVDSRTVVSNVVGTVEDYIPKYGDSFKDTYTFKITEGQEAYVTDSMGIWLKKTGDDWIKYNEATYAEGTYKYQNQLRIDGSNGTTHKLAENVDVKINGEEWTVTSCTIKDSYSYAWIESPEIVVANTTTYLITIIGYDITNTSIAGGKLYLETDKGSALNNGTLKVDGYATNNTNVVINAVADDGYEFVEWRLSGPTGSQVTINANHTFTATQQLYLYAIFQEKSVQPTTYTVTFKSNGGTPVGPITNISSGSKIAKPTNPEKIDRTFGSWYKDANLTEKFNFENDTITGDITLYASWKVDISTHTYDATNDVEKTDTAGTFSMAGVDGKKFSTVFECTEGKEYTLTATPKTGYKFVAWRSTTKDGQAISTNAEYTFTAEPLRLYAVFEEEQPATYTVTFNSNGGSAVAKITNVPSGATIKEPIAPTKADFTFAGWYKESELTNEFNFATDTITGDTTLFAKWNKKQTTSGGGGSSATTKYTITVKQNSNGKISPETIKVEKGNDQKFEIKANDGYEIEDVKVDGKSVGAVKEYTFENVKATHMIEATFKKVVPVEPEDGWKNPFVDVSEDDWYYEAVKFANENKLFNGVSENEFGANVKMTRGMLVTVLYRLAGEPATNKSIPFADVDTAMYYANPISWAKQNGIVNGVDENNFAPDAEISRQQLVTILYRFAKLMGKDVSVGEDTNILSYDDVNQVAEYAIPAMQWACGDGVITGRTESTLAPIDNATRAEVATMLMRFINN